MPDPNIINRLSKYCDVLNVRRSYFKEPGWENVQDGVRHYQVRIKSPIPNFIRFGKFWFISGTKDSHALAAIVIKLDISRMPATLSFATTATRPAI